MMPEPSAVFVALYRPGAGSESFETEAVDLCSILLYGTGQKTSMLKRMVVKIDGIRICAGKDPRTTGKLTLPLVNLPCP
jgi:hypothetical protein